MNNTSSLSQRITEPLVGVLSEQLGFDVQCYDSSDTSTLDVVAAAIECSDRACVSLAGEPATIGLQLPSGRVAVWQTPTSFARQSANHAESVLALERSRCETSMLRDENEALAIQVADDFEGLSLIRSLAASLELPDDRSSVADGVMRFLCPLAEGVGAQSIAAVFLGDDEQELKEPFWSGDVLVPQGQLYDLIQVHLDESARHPVVRNSRQESAHSIAADAIGELVMVQCQNDGRLHGWLVACNRVDDHTRDVPWAQAGFSTIQASLLETAANQLAAQLHNFQLLRQKEELFTDVVRALVNAVEARDPYTCGHSERVARLARCLALASGETAAGCERIYLTGLLHDVGKIAIPDGVLQKPGKLTDEERDIIETHPDAGWRILHEVDALRDVLPGVLYHHERYDGRGYPDGLEGENIPLDGRMLAVCDAYDAMTSDRPYRTGMSIAQAVKILRSGSGSQWDPKMIGLFMENLEAMEEIRLGHQPRTPSTRQFPSDGRPMLEAASKE